MLRKFKIGDRVIYKGESNGVLVVAQGKIARINGKKVVMKNDRLNTLMEFSESQLEKYNENTEI